MTEYALVFTAGLLGSAHCLGMCGGFVLAIAQRKNPGRVWIHQTGYFLGKTITYILLGILVGWLGHTFGGLFKGFQSVISIVAGVLMILIGIGLLGWIRRIEEFISLTGNESYRGAFRSLAQSDSISGTLGLGLLNGLLPCGLVYGMLAKAAASPGVTEAAITMLVFGIATIPALFILGMVGHLLKPLWRARLNMVAGVIVILLGAMTVLRGTPWAGSVMQYLPGMGHDGHEMAEPMAPSHMDHQM